MPVDWVEHSHYRQDDYTEISHIVKSSALSVRPGEYGGHLRGNIAVIRLKCFASIVWLVLLLAGCAESSSGVRDLAYHNNSLYLCGWKQVQRLSLYDNSVENYPFRCDMMFEAMNGWIWVAAGHSIKVYNGKEWQDIDLPRDSNLGDVSDLNYLSETRDGLIWASSTLLSYYDPKTGHSTVVVPSIPVDPATPAPVPGEWAVSLPSKGHLGPVFEAADGAIWYNQQFDGIVRWDRTTGQKHIWGADSGFQGFAPIPSRFVQTLDGDIWVGTDTGVYRFHDDTWQTWTLPGEGVRFQRADGDYRVIGMIKDRDGDVWVAFNRAGVATWNGTEWSTIGNFEFPAGPLTLFEDSRGEIWIGSLQRGVARVRQGTLKAYPEIRLVTFLETPDHLLFGSDNISLFLYDRSTEHWEPYPNKKNIPG